MKDFEINVLHEEPIEGFSLHHLKGGAAGNGIDPQQCIGNECGGHSCGVDTCRDNTCGTNHCKLNDCNINNCVSNGVVILPPPTVED